MIKFCRNCGEELTTSTAKTCSNCSSNAVKATAYCRYCGYATTFEAVTCSHCGAALKPLPSSVRTLFEYPRLSAKMGKIVNLSIVFIMVASYVVFSLPKSITKPVKAATSDAVMASTGYTALPLNSIEASPPLIPELVTYGMTYVPPGITVNTIRHLTVYAVYKNTTSANATKAVRLVNITDNCTYTSPNERIATVNQSGAVKATGPGTINITISYTAAPGSANMSAASDGKKLATFTTNVQVFVK
jgi:hypothetical protein